MNYLELEFPVTEPMQAELLSALLSDYGFEGVEELPDSLKAYIPENHFNEIDFLEFLKRIPSFEKIAFTQKKLPVKNWNEEWEKNYDPVVISNRVRLRAKFHPPNENFEYDILIDPQMSFGTGHHATTQLMIEMMLGMDFHGMNALDFGSGTGVLAIIARKMGAKSVIAVDIDEWAFHNISENMVKNNAGNIQPLLGDSSVIPNEKFEIILANVNKNMIIENMELLAFRLCKNGTVLFSGLLAGDENDVLKAAHDNDLILQDKKTKKEWLCLKFVKK